MIPIVVHFMNINLWIMPRYVEQFPFYVLEKSMMNCANTEGIFRLIQSIPSPKAEPFKLWLARVGYERVEETEDPEKAIQRALATYLKKGYSKEWEYFMLSEKIFSENRQLGFDAIANFGRLDLERLLTSDLGKLF